MKTLLEDRDVQSAVDTYADDATLTLYDQGGLVVREDQTEAWFENALNSPETITWSMDAVAVRGDLLCLIRHHRYPDSGFGTDSLNVLEIDPDGLARRFARFQNEDLRQAHDWLNQWWIEGLPPELAPVASAVVRIAHLIEDGDRTALDGFLNDDLVVDDHRRLGFGRTDKDGLIEVWLSRQQITPGFMVLIPTIERLTSMGCVAPGDFLTPDGFVTSGVMLQIMKDGLFSHMEHFEDDDLDTALARFDELTSTPPN